jgi:hypothetical protein
MSPAKKKQKDTLPTSPAMRELKALASTPQAVTRLKPVVPAPNGHDIAVRAYELFVERGGQHGNDWEDWFLAEQQLTVRG